jgi:hypothetical protein
MTLLHSQVHEQRFLHRITSSPFCLLFHINSIKPANWRSLKGKFQNTQIQMISGKYLQKVLKSEFGGSYCALFLSSFQEIPEILRGNLFKKELQCVGLIQNSRFYSWYDIEYGIKTMNANSFLKIYTQLNQNSLTEFEKFFCLHLGQESSIRMNQRIFLNVLENFQLKLS